MHILSLVSLVWLSTLFVYSASLKLVRYDRAASSVSGYGFIPLWAAQSIGYALPWVEFAVVVALGFSATQPAGASIAAAFGLSFSAVGTAALLLDERPSCGCTGSGGDVVGWQTIVRGVLIAAAATTIYASWPTTLPWPAMACALVIALIPALLVACRRLGVMRAWRRHQMALKAETEYMAQLIAAPPERA